MAKIAFLQNLWLEWYGVMCLSSALKKEGHDTELFIGRKNIIKELKRYKPDIFAISIMNTQFEWLKDIVSILRKNNFKQPIIVGGPHATCSPEEVIDIDGISAICTGEGEEALKEFVEAIVKRESCDKIKNLWIKKNESTKDGEPRIVKNPVRFLENDLDKMPYPDRDIYRKYKYFIKNKTHEVFLASRGCRYSCSFCFNHLFKELYNGKGESVRFRSPQNVIDEIKDVQKKYGIQTVMFADSTFNLRKEWLIEFCKLFAYETNLPVTFNIRADLMDEDIAKALSGARCSLARFGIETGNDNLRNKILKKEINNHSIFKTANLLKKFRIPFAAYNMMGLPTETLDMAWETIHMNQKIHPDVVIVDIFIPYPNLNITKYAQKNGLLDEDFFSKITKGKHKVFRSVLKQKNIKRISNLHKFSPLLIRFPKLESVVKKIINLPENFVFDAIYGLLLTVDFIYYTKISKIRAIVTLAKNFRELS